MNAPRTCRQVASVALLLLAVMLAVAGCSTSAPKQPASLPKVTLESFDSGAALDLSTVRGPAVVNVWASWCGPCRRELPLYQAFSTKYAGKVKVIGLDFQDPQSGKAHELIRRSGVTYPLYKDPDGDVRAPGLPQLILLDARGRIVLKQSVEITSVGQLENLVSKHLGIR